ncbi:ATP-binding protein [Dehalobacter sp. DCM]|uniref:ATP-binding protein n=1 Tax=Dehalobacter sp. DCM TaxID=2907827 RepID=UPI003081CA00|nr:ATP-binding protein [Dehalobacter sp. DCM]
MSHDNPTIPSVISMTDIDIKDPISRLVQHTTTCCITDTGSKAHEIFEQQSLLEGIVILDNDRPAGLIMRADYYQKIGTQYGYSLYSRRPVTYLMETSMLIVDHSVEIAKVSALAMKRDHKNIYDLIVVTKNDVFLGVVSIRVFLMELTKKREKEIEWLKMANEKEKAFSDTIAATNAELSQKNESIKNLLDHAGQGFLSFSGNYLIHNEYSAECVKIFGCEIVARHFLDIVAPYFKPADVAGMEATLTMLFAGENDISAEVYFSLLPQEMTVHGRTVALEYKLLSESDLKVMVILTDITEKIELNRRMKEEEKNLRLILKAIQNYDDMKMSIEEMCQLFRTGWNNRLDESQNGGETLTEIFRSVHTYKGELAQHGLYNTSAHLHALEDQLADLLKEAENPSLLNHLKNILAGIDPSAILADDMQVITGALGEDYFTKTETFVVTKEQIEAICTLIKRVCKEEQQHALTEAVKKLLCRNFKDFLKEYDGYVEYLGSRLGKKIALHIEGDDIFVYKPLYSGLLKSLIHIVRNAADHGIESADARMEAGKPECAAITCQIRRLDPNYFALSVTDDGHGIDLMKIKDKVLEAGLASQEELSCMPPADLLPFIFKEHFSTKAAVDTLSGRGIGLSAVKHEAEKLGGNITVSTNEGSGTEFVITLPIMRTFNL